MSKIRINELARQLEVKSREVIDKLHELGIAEKVTHSSSIDEDRADQLRRYYRGESHAPTSAALHRNGSGVAVEEREELEPRAPAEREDIPQRPERRARVTQPEPPAAVVPSPAPPPAVTPVTPLPPEPAAAEKSSATPAEAEKADDENRPRAIPLRPPMLGRGAPVHPPVGARSLRVRQCLPRHRPAVLFRRLRARFRLRVRRVRDRCCRVLASRCRRIWRLALQPRPPRVHRLRREFGRAFRLHLRRVRRRRPVRHKASVPWPGSRPRGRLFRRVPISPRN